MPQDVDSTNSFVQYLILWDEFTSYLFDLHEKISGLLFVLVCFNFLTYVYVFVLPSKDPGTKSWWGWLSRHIKKTLEVLHTQFNYSFRRKSLGDLVCWKPIFSIIFWFFINFLINAQFAWSYVVESFYSTFLVFGFKLRLLRYVYRTCNKA